jgi:hypothetical protein
MAIDAIGRPGNDWLRLLPPGERSPANAPDRADVDREPRAARVSPGSPGDAVKPRQCRTCAERKYKDVSDDPSVSFQAPTSVAPEQAAAAVAAHEQEHVTNNAARAERAGMAAQSTVAIHTAVCPECGRSYVSGGTTTTTYTRKATDSADEPGRGLLVDAVA